MWKVLMVGGGGLVSIGVFLPWYSPTGNPLEFALDTHHVPVLFPVLVLGCALGMVVIVVARTQYPLLGSIIGLLAIFLASWPTAAAVLQPCPSLACPPRDS